MHAMPFLPFLPLMEEPSVLKNIPPVFSFVVKTPFLDPALDSSPLLNVSSS